MLRPDCESWMDMLAWSLLVWVARQRKDRRPVRFKGSRLVAASFFKLRGDPGNEEAAGTMAALRRWLWCGTICWRLGGRAPQARPAGIDAEVHDNAGAGPGPQINTSQWQLTTDRQQHLGVHKLSQCATLL